MGGAGTESREGESFVQKALTKGGAWDQSTFEDFPDAVYWLRQITALGIGLAWGVIPMTGAPGLVSFGVINYTVCFLYYSKYAEVDEEEFVKQSDLRTEGLKESVGLFLLTWIFTYSILHA